MVEKRCASKMCFNSTRDSPQIHFFTFPTNQEHARIWAEACGIPELMLKSKTSIKRYVLCAEHFEDHWFIDPKRKTAFIKNKIPIPTIFKNNLKECISRQTNATIDTNITKSKSIVEELKDYITYNVEEENKQSNRHLSVKDKKSVCSVKPINDIVNNDKDSTIITTVAESHRDDTLQKDVEELCRLCALPTSNNMLHSIYDNDMDKKINTILPLQLEVHKYDGLPQEICHLCIHKVKLCYDFIQQFLDANSKLLMHKNERQDVETEEDNLLLATLSERSLFSATESICDDNVHLDDDNYQNIEKTNYYTYTPSAHKNESDDGKDDKDDRNNSTHYTEHSYNLPLRNIPERTNTLDDDKLDEINIDNVSNDMHDIVNNDNIVKKNTSITYNCKTCNELCHSKLELHRHNETHKEENKFYCAHCPKSFRVKSLLKQHMCSHSGTRPYVCDICGASYNRRGNMGQHRKTHFVIENGEPRLIKEGIRCSICRKKVKSLLMLKYHLAKHNGEKKAYVCTICGKCFTTGSQLKVHQFLHTGERPFTCPECGKGFRTEAIMKQHYLALHTNDYPHKCPYCDRKFKRLQSLIVHKRTHTGERPYPCPICGRAFAQKGDMMKHTKIHNSSVDKHIKNTNNYLEMQVIDDDKIQIRSTISEEITIFEIEDDGITNEFINSENLNK
ncbi:PREDICTED: zinc finger protein 267 [Polistes dominula]|uniref:Zinc finger protein 267 n=1 Tax=Polistes dominula TaxID=743375 RepID=A0ABM1J7G3_POLDO|nr:PREDICTED: zinc finger protein 267 [Polistes dominula]XP_015188402.1 PREDICTED: zinc finger protein 267 [Polistes dominula]